MPTIGIICIIVSILLIIYAGYKLRHIHNLNQEIDNQNFELEQKHKDLEYLLHSLNSTIEMQENKLKTLQDNFSRTLDNQKELSQKAFESYCEVLEKQYEEYEQEYEMHKDTLEESYSNKQLELVRELNETKKDLDKIKATRAAAIQAQIKEKEIKEDLSFYCLTLKQTELEDIKILERIKPQLNNSRILSMLIWQTYYQKPMTALCNNILGTDTICGIYKITNQIDNMCYIGQSVDISRRWKEHAKCGLGIDTPAGNKLYKAIQEVGLHNFSFELLEQCPREQLDEKEKYYINLYQSNEFGYNSTIGIN